MNLLVKRFLFVLLLICPYILVFGIIMKTNPSDLFNINLRISGLFGFLSLSLGVIMNLLKKEIKSVLGHPFITIHHILGVSGLVLITIHPLMLALSFNDFSIFIPNTSSVYIFLSNGGKVAIILIYLGFFAAIFRNVFKKRWIQIHRIIYLALMLGIIHANISGEDLFDPVIRIMLNAIAGIVLITGILKMRNRRHLEK